MHPPTHPPTCPPLLPPQRAKTDAFDGLEWDNPERPEARNLLTIYSCVTGEPRGAWGAALQLPAAAAAPAPRAAGAAGGAPPCSLPRGRGARPRTRPPSLPLHPPAGQSKEAVLAEVGGLRWGDFKPRLADALVAHLAPIQERYRQVSADEGALDAILAKVRGCWGLRGRAPAGLRPACRGEQERRASLGASQLPCRPQAAPPTTKHAASQPPRFHHTTAQGADVASAEAYATLDNVRRAMGFGAVHGRRFGE